MTASEDERPRPAPDSGAAVGRLSDFAVVVPMYNEEAGAEACVRAITDALAAFRSPALMIAVDDGSADATPAILDRLAAGNARLSVIHHEINRGYGAALRSGAKEAARRRLAYVLFMDSDLTNPAAHIGRFVAAMGDDWDVIKGCRFRPGGGMEGVAPGRALMSRLGNVAAARLFRMGLRDYTNGFRAVRTDRFLALPLTESGFAIIIEEMYFAKRLAYKVTEVPTTLFARSGEQRPTAFSYRPSAIARYLKYALMACVTRSRSRAGG